MRSEQKGKRRDEKSRYEDGQKKRRELLYCVYVKLCFGVLKIIA